MPRRLDLILIILLLFIAAFVRIADLHKLPAGYTDEEIGYLRIAESVRAGSIGVFYNVEGPGFQGREGAYPIFLATTGALLGDGMFGYRMLSVWAGLISVALMYALARRFYGRPEAFICAILFGIGLYPVLLSRGVLAQSLLLPVYLGALYAMANGLHLRQSIRPLPPSTTAFTFLAVLGTLSVYLHFTGLMIVPLLTVFFVYLRVTGQPLSRRVRAFGLYAGLLAAILGIPYLTSTARVLDLSGFGVLITDRPETFWAIFTHLWDVGTSLLNFGVLGVFGVLLVVATGGLLVYGLVTALRNRQTPAYMLVLLMFVAGVLPVLWTDRADYNLAFVLPAATFLIAIGLMQTLKWLRDALDLPMARRIVWLTPLLTLCLAAGLYTDYFDRWRTDLDLSRRYHGYLGTLAVYLDAQSDDSVPTLVCTDDLAGSPMQPVPPPLLMEMMMHRSTRNVRFSACGSAIVILDGGKTQRVAFNFDGTGKTPPALQNWLNVLRKKPVEVMGARRTALYEMEGERELADAIGKITLSHVQWPPDLPNPDDPVRLPVRMGDNLTFEGYSLDAERTLKPGDIFTVTTYWRVDGEQSADLSLFTHLLLDPGSAPVAQNDSLDVATLYLHPRDIVIQTSRVQIPYPFPEGTYYLSVGAYHASDGVRVPIYDEQDKVRGDRLFIGTVTIKG